MRPRWPLRRRGVALPTHPADLPDSLPEKIWYLRQARLFERLTEPELDRLARMSEMREYGRGEAVLSVAPDPDLIYIVKAGRVKLSARSPVGREQVLALLDRGDLFGGLGSSMSTRAEALEPAVVCWVRRPLFEDLVRRFPEVALRVIDALTRRLRAAEQEIADLALRDVPGRLASLLLRFAEEYGEPHDRGIRLSFRLTHKDLAQMIGSTRETVTSMMTRFRDDGVVEVEQHTLVIHDRERLRAIADARRV